MTWRRTTLLVMLSVPVVALFGFGLRHDPHDIPSPLPGHEAPPFTLGVITRGDLATTAGDTVALARYRGQVVVVNFWASWCLACRSEHVELSRVASAYAGRGVQFLGVLHKDRDESAKSWIAAMGGQSYPTLRDPGSRTAIDFGLYGVPETFFIGPDGRVTYKQVGPVSEQVLREQIEIALGRTAMVAK